MYLQYIAEVRAQKEARDKEIDQWVAAETQRVCLQLRSDLIIILTRIRTCRFCRSKWRSGRPNRLPGTA